MEVLIQTRGLTADYQFLGSAPRQRWWLAYDSCTITTNPTAIVRGTGDRWQAYLSGIPSARGDYRGRRPIRFDLVLSGDTGDEAVADFVPLLRAWLDFAGRGDDRLQKSLDAELPEKVVEELLATPGLGDERDQRIAAWARDHFADAGVEPVKAAARRSGRWLGSLGDDDARKEYLAHAAGILHGDAPGRALVLNLLETQADIEEQVQADDGDHGCVILATRLAERLDGPLVRLAETPPPNGGDPEKNGPALPSWLWLVVGLAGAGLAGLVIWWALTHPEWRRLP